MFGAIDTKSHKLKEIVRKKSLDQFIWQIEVVENYHVMSSVFFWIGIAIGMKIWMERLLEGDVRLGELWRPLDIETTNVVWFSHLILRWNY